MTAPQIQACIHALGKARLDGEVSYDRKTNRLLAELFDLLQRIEPDDQTGRWEFWLTAPRGTFRDFKENYVGYYAELDGEDGELSSDDIEDWWKGEFSEAEAWIHFAAAEDKKDGYRAVFLNHRCVIEQRPWICDGEQKDVSDLVKWMLTAVKAVIIEVRNGNYNGRVEKELPLQYRVGTMTREVFWQMTPWLRKNFFRTLSERDIDEFMAYAVEDPTQVTHRIKEMTANDFFSFCAIGYKENGYMATHLPPKQQYGLHANGQDDGLTKIDPDSPQVFADWFHNHKEWGHPWEVSRGSSWEHICLFVHEDKKGYYLTVSGASYTKCREAIKFYLALRRAGLPVCMAQVEQLKQRLLGTEKIGVVPRGILPVDCQWLFPGKDIIDFTHLPEGKRRKAARYCTWQELKSVRLRAFEGGGPDGIVA